MDQINNYHSLRDKEYVCTKVVVYVFFILLIFVTVLVGVLSWM